MCLMISTLQETITYPHQTGGKPENHRLKRGGMGWDMLVSREQYSKPSSIFRVGWAMSFIFTLEDRINHVFFIDSKR